MARLCLAGVLATVASADSITSCGTDTDHLQVTQITVDADATGGIKKGKPFSITLAGILDEPHTSGTISGDVTLKALGIVDKSLSRSKKYDFLPGFPTGTNKVVVGPFTFPKSIPGKFEFSGQVRMVNDKAEPVACVNVDVVIPKILFGEEELSAEKSGCGDASGDHMTNIVSTKDSAGVLTTTMDVDEDLSSVIVGVDLSVKASFVPAVGVSLPSIPVTLTPALPAGQFKFVAYPSTSTPANSLFGWPLPNSVITTSGSVTVKDENGEEVVCIDIGADTSLAVSV